MMFIRITIFIALFMLTKTLSAQEHFICYTYDDDKTVGLSISFDSAGRAKYVLYKGQKKSIPLVFLKENVQTEGAVTKVNQIYIEKIRGSHTGTYVLTHSGIWDYAEYTRKSDGKRFSFTIDRIESIKDEAYRTTPCE